MADGTDPTDQLGATKDRYHIHDIGTLHGADKGVVVGEYIAGADPGVVFVVVMDHPFDKTAGSVNMHHNAVRECDCIALRCVERDDTLADLAHARRGRDTARHFPCGDTVRPQFRVQRFVLERVLLTEGKFGYPIIATGLAEQSFALLKLVFQNQRASSCFGLLQHPVCLVSYVRSAGWSTHRPTPGPPAISPAW